MDEHSHIQDSNDASAVLAAEASGVSEHKKTFLHKFHTITHLTYFLPAVVVLLILISSSLAVLSTKQTKHSTIKKTASPNPTITPTLTSTPSATLSPNSNAVPTTTTIKSLITATPTVTSTKNYIIIDDTSPVHDGVISNTTQCLQLTYHKNPPGGNVMMNWKMDQGSWGTWTSIYQPCIFAYLSNGSHTFSVQLKDDLGNMSSIVSHTFTIDTSSTNDTEPPQIQQFGGPADGSTITTNHTCFPSQYSDNMGVSGQSEMYIQAQYQLDNNDWSSWSADNFAACVSNLSNGSHSFSIRAKDRAGNTSSTSTKHFTVSM